ncbi:MAG TPA: Gfo/Idh/MocA family oxidoreductase [Phycisphaerae bacterium]|jgi:predicted dehydrogenase|nr:Gfo/Idh/MocA family oxidoreductase [Phycisphaerae bacterium]HOB73277.1 Gfo/Idh/MocA family oxidoreductase [Phycisphaerae bacterium]HOJ54910.1 Gfo/Idh/MocA family oxidoreductase [Phycisphaerae bacterium]HOL26096.1 Gfo/Idh/MocA family oxidoreductase [Phycisphaerae bacterium]HPP23017.1 Gfo/Idh/MocA family oxidoreductase [Phycisphaerae bacterium]
MDPLKVGLIGLGHCGILAAEALLASSWCRLTAVGSHRPYRLQRFAESHPGIAAYDDFRSLIVNNPLDALFIAAPPFVRPAYLAMAAERGLPVWMVTPAARTLDEAMELLDMFDAAGVPLVVYRAYGLDPALQEDSIGPEATGRLFLARGHTFACIPEDLDWRGDSERAGGGVLLDRAYGLIDLVVLTMGMPGSVYAAAAGVSRPGTRFPYDTEDTASLICQFAGGAIAQITACWTAGPEQAELNLYGLKTCVRIDERTVSVRDRAGTTELHQQDRPANPLAPQIEDFLTTLRTAPKRVRSNLQDHLATMAVLEAAYLSIRTGQPESPGPILDMHQRQSRPARSAREE